MELLEGTSEAVVNMESFPGMDFFILPLVLVVLYIATSAGTMSAHTFCGTLLMLTNQMASVNENEQNHSEVVYLHQSKQN